MIIQQVNTKKQAVILHELNNAISSGVFGDVVEFGCYEGQTSILLARTIINTDKKLYIYDSFEGLPDKSSLDNSPTGEQFKTGELFVSKRQLLLNLKKANIKMPIIKKAWFSDLSTVDIPKQISFAFLDGDYFESIKDSFRGIQASIHKGSVIVVDDYNNDSLPGVRKAVDNWLKTHKAKFRVEQGLAIIQVL